MKKCMDKQGKFVLALVYNRFYIFLESYFFICRIQNLLYQLLRLIGENKWNIRCKILHKNDCQMLNVLLLLLLTVITINTSK